MDQTGLIIFLVPHLRSIALDQANLRSIAAVVFIDATDQNGPELQVRALKCASLSRVGYMFFNSVALDPLGSNALAPLKQ